MPRPVNALGLELDLDRFGWSMFMRCRHGFRGGILIAMDQVTLVREKDAYLHTLDVDIHEWEGKWRVRVVGRCDEKSPMPASFEWLPGGKTAGATEPFMKKAIAKFKRDGWLDQLAPDAQARIDARQAAKQRAANAKVDDYKARVKKFPTSKLDHELAAAIAKPKGVIELDLRGDKTNRLTAIPPTIQKLADLEVLHLESNALPEIADEIGKLRALRELHLANNKLAELPRAVWFLRRLVVLNLHANEFVKMPAYYGNYQKRGIEFQIAGNPLEIVPGLPWDKLRAIGLDTDHLFPLDEGKQTWPVETLHLYGRAPTKQELAQAKQTFPKATIEHIADIADGPRMTARAAPSLAAPAPKGKSKPLHAEQVAHLEELVALGKKKHVPEAALEKLVRPCVELFAAKATKADLAPGKTRLGGVPDLAPGTAWPRGVGGPMLFVAQLDLAQIAPFDTKGQLPPTGLLSFFAGNFDEGSVLYTASGAEPVAWPKGVICGYEKEPEPLPACAVKLRGAVNVAFSNSKYANEDDEEAGWYGLAIKYRRRGGKEAMHQVLGYELGDSGEAVEDNDVVLLRLGSDDRAKMLWGDAGNLYFVIDPKSLAKRDWSQVRVVPTE